MGSQVKAVAFSICKIIKKSIFVIDPCSFLNCAIKKSNKHTTKTGETESVNTYFRAFQSIELVSFSSGPLSFMYGLC